MEKLQNLPLATRKKILWAAVTIVGIILLFFVIQDIKKSLREFQEEELGGSFNFPSSIGEEFKLK